MPAIHSREIVDRIGNAILDSGGVPTYLSDNVQAHPRIFGVDYQGNSYTIWVYIWTLTHGGRVSLPNELRIQLTSVSSPLRLNPSGFTVLMGLHETTGVFAGFDLLTHHTFSTGSSSVQIDLQAVNQALQDGLAFSRKENDEIAVGVRSDQFLNYVRHAQDFHEFGQDAAAMSLLESAAANQDVAQDELAGVGQDRQVVIRSVRQYARDGNFARQVLSAYENRCAISRWQLRLVDAAHILPVAAQGPDTVTNGISLSPTLHRAYDSALIYIDEDWCIRLNPERANQLTSLALDGGLGELRLQLERTIHLPANPAQYPSSNFIRLANRHRRIPGY